MYRLLALFFVFGSLYSQTAEPTSASPPPKNTEAGATSKPKPDFYYEPWYTGPLLAPSGRTVPPGVINLQPYLFVTNNYGQFDSTWRYHHIGGTNVLLNPVAVLQIGLTPWMDVTGVFQLIYSSQNSGTSTNYGDTTAKLGFQILTDKKGTIIPDTKVGIGVIFPTGKFEDLSPDNYVNQASGSGSYEIVVSLAFQKFFDEFQLFSWSYNPFRLRLSFQYQIPTAVSVDNFNTYGGGFGTDATIYPGNLLTIIGAWEMSLTQKWAVAVDLQYNDAQAVTWKGIEGSLNGSPAQIGKGYSQQVSIAPALEYNFSDNFGVVAGIWTSLGGRNIGSFLSYIFSFDWAF